MQSPKQQYAIPRPTSTRGARRRRVQQQAAIARGGTSAASIVRAGGSGASGAPLATHDGQLGGDDERLARPTTTAEVGGDGEQRAAARIGELEGRLGGAHHAV